MKLLLISPPIEDFYDTEIRLQPIGLAYLKASVKKHLPHVEVKILDAHRGFGKKTISLPKEFNSLKRYWHTADQSPFCGFHAYYHFGASFEYIAAFCLREKPDVIGLSSLFSPYHREVLKTAAAIKAEYDCPIVVGGSHASACPDLLLDSPYIDFVIRGEGERPLVEFLTSYKDKNKYRCISGLGYKVNGEKFYNALEPNWTLDSLPIPDLEDLKQENYLFEGKPLCFVVTSRSCPHRCSFCSVHTTFGYEYRRMSVDCILQMLHQRYEQGYRVFDFEDDNLTYFKPQMKALCQRIISEFKGKPIQLLAMNGISYLSLDNELLDLMRQAGFTNLNLALVSSDTLILQSTKRPHTVSKYLEVVQLGYELGYKITSYQILGLKYENLASMIQTLVFNARLPVLLGASIFYMTPQSPIAKEHGLETNDLNAFTARSTSLRWEFQDWCRDDIYTLFITTRMINFLKSLTLESVMLTKEDRISDLPVRVASGINILKKLFTEKRLSAETKRGYVLLEAFRFDLFERVFFQLEYIKNLENKLIDIHDLFCFNPGFNLPKVNIA